MSGANNRCPWGGFASVNGLSEAGGLDQTCWCSFEGTGIVHCQVGVSTLPHLNSKLLENISEQGRNDLR